MRVYDALAPITSMPDVATLPLVGTAYTNAINIQNGYGNFYWAPLVSGTPENHFAVTWTGSVNVIIGGSYTFCTSSDDGSTISIGGSVVVTNNGIHGWLTKCGTVNLSPGLHSAYVDYFQNEFGDGIQATWSGPDTDNTEVLLQQRPKVHTSVPTLFAVAVGLAA